MRFKQESVKHRTRIADTDKGLSAMENDLVLLSLTVQQPGFSALTHFHRSCIRILAIFERVREVPGHEWAIPLLERSLLAPTQARLNRTGPTSSASSPARVCQICTIQPADRGANLSFTRVAIRLPIRTLRNLAIEFWPEIH